MGFSLDGRGKPTFADTPTQTIADLQKAADWAEKIGGVLKLTRAQRLLLTSGELSAGWLVSETDTGALYQWSGSAWRSFATAAGVVVCPASGGGGSSPVFWTDLIDVTFPTNRFTAAPRVFVQTIGPASQVPFGGVVEQITASGCKVRGIRIAAVPDASFSVEWLAVAV